MIAEIEQKHIKSANQMLPVRKVAVDGKSVSMTKKHPRAAWIAMSSNLNCSAVIQGYLDLRNEEPELRTALEPFFQVDLPNDVRIFCDCVDDRPTLRLRACGSGAGPSRNTSRKRKKLLPFGSRESVRQSMRVRSSKIETKQ